MAEGLAGLTLPKLAEYAQAGLATWLVLLALVVSWQLFIRGRALDGILASRPGSGPEPDRLQMLLAGGGGAIAYAVLCAQAIEAGAKRMPDAPIELLTIMGASQAIYLGGKFARLRS